MDGRFVNTMQSGVLPLCSKVCRFMDLSEFKIWQVFQLNLVVVVMLLSEKAFGTFI